MNGPHDIVDGLVADARDVLERERGAIPPDFGAVLSRAGLAAAPTSGDNVLAMPTRGRVEAMTSEEDATERSIDGLVDAAQNAIDDQLAQRRMRPIPALVLPKPAPRRRGAMVIGVALLAATVVAVLGGLQWVRSLRPADVDEAREQAFNSQVDTGPDGVAREAEPEPPRARVPSAPPSISLVAPTIAPPTSAVLERNSARPSADRLRALADLAHARWRAGDRAGAESKFERVVKLGGRSGAAELAYGDLFALARQLHDPDKQRARWRAYLGRFPKGRFADDARAGLCRAAGDAKCWSDYLRDFPRGSYRSEATRAADKVAP